MKILFATQDLQRLQGLEEIIPDLAIACVDRNELADNMEKIVQNFFSLSDHQDTSEVLSTSELLNSPPAEKFIEEFFGNEQVRILVFKNNPKLQKMADSKGWELLNNHPKYNKIFEDKISFVEECIKSGTKIPKTIIVRLKEKSYEELSESLGSEFVLQFRRGHAGQSTFFVSSEEQYNELKKDKADFPARISEYIEGHTLTYNICIRKDGVDYSNLMYQISNQPEFNRFRGGTCGVDMIKAKEYQEYEKELKKIAGNFVEHLKEGGYKGFLGLDFIVGANGECYLLECNPRLTANLALNTQVELLQGKKPLIQQHIEEFLGEAGVIDSSTKNANENEQKKNSLGSFFILRNCREYPVLVKSSPKAGRYRLENDSEITFIDETFKLAKCADDEFILEIESKVHGISPDMKINTILAPFSMFDEEGNIRQFAREFQDKFDIRTIYISPKDFWEGVYGRPTKECIDVLRKPFKDFGKLSARARTKNRQSQALEDEGTFQILGEKDSAYLIKKWDNSHGWVDKNEVEKLDKSDEKYQLVDKEKDVFIEDKNASEVEARVTKFLEKYKNTPYLWGGVSRNGIDCSGFTQRYMLEVFGIGLPKYSLHQIHYGKAISKDELADHCLVFLNHKEKGRSHVGFYYKGQFIHSSFTKNSIQKEALFDAEDGTNGLLADYELVAIREF